MSVCPRCKKEFTPKWHHQVYCSNLCKTRNSNDRHWKKRHYADRVNHCECCGFNNPKALHFHHLVMKRFRKKPAGPGFPPDTWDVDDRGITLCANCHYIFHATIGYVTSVIYTKEQVLEIIKNGD